MDTLDGLKTVIAVVETGSFTAAAKRLMISKGLVSKYINEIESTLAIRLFNRTTRKISLTDTGKHYYLHALQLLEKYDSMIDEVIGEQSTPKGVLRVSSPLAFGENIIAPLIPEFVKRYPNLKLELVLNNKAVNMLEEGIDVRIKSGQIDDSNMIARKLCQWPLIVCASSQYLEKYGVPLRPQDLSNYYCVLDSNLKNGENWSFLSKHNKLQNVLVKSNIATNNPQAVINIVKAGGGIGLVARKSIEEELNSGSLVELFKTEQPLILDIYIIYPHRHHVSRKVNCFIDFMFEKLEQSSSLT